MEISQLKMKRKAKHSKEGREMLDDHSDVENTKLAATGWTGTPGSQPALGVHPGLFLSVGKPVLRLLLVNIT